MINYKQLTIVLVIIVFLGYSIGLNVVNIVDKRLSDISINIPKSSIVLKVKNENEHFTNFNPRDYADAQISCEEVDTSENDLLPKEDFEFLNLKTPMQVCYQNHKHDDCNYGLTNFGDPYYMSDIDKNSFKYNFDYTKCTLQDYVNWLYLFHKNPYELPYNHQKTLKKLMNNIKIKRVPKVNHQLNSIEYFNKLYNSGHESYTNKNRLSGYNYNEYFNQYSDIDNTGSIGTRG